MNIIFFLCRIVIITVLTVFTAEKLYANSSTAGNTVTVNRDSGFNALRSPSLMSWQQDNSISLGFVYTLQAYNKIDGTVNNGILNAPIDADSKNIFKGSALFSYVLRCEDHSFGAGIRSTDDGQFSLSESSQDFTLSGSNLKSSEKNKNINVSSVLSYSYRLNNRQTVGVQVETGYTVTSVSKNTKIPIIPADIDTDITKKSINATTSIGYSYITNTVETGFMFNAGEYSKETDSGSRSGTSGGLAVSGHENSDSGIYQSKGYGVMAGIAFRPYYKLLVNIEAGIQIPFEENKKALNDNLVVVNNKFESSGLYLARLGVDYLIDQNFSAGFGAGYAFSSSEIHGSDAKSTAVDLDLLEFTTGLEYRLYSKLSLLLSCSLFYITTGMDIEDSGMEIDLSADTLNVNFTTGVSMRF